MSARDDLAKGLGDLLIKAGAWISGRKYYPGKKNPDFGAVRDLHPKDKGGQGS